MYMGAWYKDYLKNSKIPILIVYNKVDLIKNIDEREINVFSYKKTFETNLDSVKISAKTGRNIDDLIKKIKSEKGVIDVFRTVN